MLETLDFDGLVLVLSGRRKAEPVTIITRTAPKMNKGGKGGCPINPYYGKVERIAERNVFIGADYSSCVNRQRDREGVEETFVAEALWKGAGERVNQYMARHKVEGKLYLVYKPTTDKENEIRTKQSVYINTETGEEIAEELLKPWFPKISASKVQGVEREVFWRTLEVSNIRRIAVGGQLFEVRIADNAPHNAEESLEVMNEVVRR